MSISAVAQYLELHWNTVKEIEKHRLRKKYRHIKLSKVTAIGIDEVHIGRKFGFFTIVRDLIDGRTLFVGEGKNADCLKPFLQKLKSAKAQIETAAIDMGNAYSS